MCAVGAPENSFQATPRLLPRKADKPLARRGLEMDEQPDAQIRRKLLRDLLGLAVGSYVTATKPPLGMVTGAGAGQPSPEGLQPTARPLQTRLAEKTGLSLHQIEESHLGDLVSDLRAALERGEASIRIPREELVGFVAAFAGAKFYQEKHVHLTGLQLSKQVNGSTFDIVANASFGRLFVQLRESPVSEEEVSDFLKLCDTSNAEEGWLIAPDLETRLVRAEPVRLWENRYVVPVVRLMSFDAIFDALLSPAIAPLRCKAAIEDGALVLHLSLEKEKRDP